MTIQKIFTSRIKNTTGNTFVGEKGRVFYDENVGDFRLSDGHTPGGILLFPDVVSGRGNITVYNVSVLGNLAVVGNTYSYNSINVNNVSTTTNALSVTGNATFTGNTTFTGSITDIGNLIVTGTSVLDGVAANITVQSANYNMSVMDYTVLANASAAPFTVFLPPTPLNGELHNIKKIDSSANAVIISGNGHNIDGAAFANIVAQWQNIQVQYATAITAWYII